MIHRVWHPARTDSKYVDDNGHEDVERVDEGGKDWEPPPREDDVTMPVNTSHWMFGSNFSHYE